MAINEGNTPVCTLDSNVLLSIRFDFFFNQYVCTQCIAKRADLSIFGWVTRHPVIVFELLTSTNITPKIRKKEGKGTSKYKYWWNAFNTRRS